LNKVERSLLLAGVVAAGTLWCGIGSRDRALAVNYVEPVCSDDVECAQIREWYARVRQPTSTTVCCGEADAYWTDEYRSLENGSLDVTITDGRIVPNRMDLNGHHVAVPKDRIDPKHQGNPTGHGIIFVRHYSDNAYPDFPYCYFPNVSG
jgi:hypothetical protein